MWSTLAIRVKKSPPTPLPGCRLRILDRHENQLPVSRFSILKNGLETRIQPRKTRVFRGFLLGHFVTKESVCRFLGVPFGRAVKGGKKDPCPLGAAVSRAAPPPPPWVLPWGLSAPFPAPAGAVGKRVRPSACHRVEPAAGAPPTMPRCRSACRRLTSSCRACSSRASSSTVSRCRSRDTAPRATGPPSCRVPSAFVFIVASVPPASWGPQQPPAGPLQVVLRRGQVETPAARTIARMPALIASGRSGQTSITACRSCGISAATAGNLLACSPEPPFSPRFPG